jgi:hypothetical protein
VAFVWGPVRVVIPSQDQDNACSVRSAIGNDRGVDRDGGSDHRPPRREPAPLHRYRRHGREAEAVDRRPCPARIAGGHGRRRGPDPQELDVLSRTFSLIASGPGRGGQPRAADLTSPRAAESASSTGPGTSPGSRPPRRPDHATPTTTWPAGTRSDHHILMPPAGPSRMHQSREALLTRQKRG